MLELLCHGMDEQLCVHVRPCLESAARSLNLAADFDSFEIIADDFHESEEAWLRMVSSGDGADKCMKGMLFCSENAFCTVRRATSTVFPRTQVWDQSPAPDQQVPFDSSRFSQKQADKFIHHELMLAQDLVRGDVVPADIGSDRVEAFSATWAVVIDGRLSRRALPGFSLTERRARFSRLFACAGVLLPGHWNIFQSLWDGGVNNSSEVLASIRLLPRL